MKKLYPLLLLLPIFAGCSKSSSNNPTPTSSSSTVVYTISATTSDTYRVEYEDQNAVALTETFTGKTWSKTINFPVLNATAPALIAVVSNTGSTDNLNVSITVNGTVEKTGTYTLGATLPLVELSYF